VRRIRRHGRARLALPLGASLAVVLTWGAARLLAQTEPVPFRVNAPLPHWLAPGGLLVIGGTAGPAETITLFVGARSRTKAAGPDGTFSFRVRAPSYAGLYKVAMEVQRDPDERLELGSVRVRPLKLALVGDVNLGDRVGTAISAFGVRYPWLSVAPVLRAADIAVANLECSVSTRGSPIPGKEFTFRGSPLSLRAMARYAGVDVITVANNHALDYGRIAFADTLRYAHLYGMKTIGGGADLALARHAAIFRLGGLRVALLGYSDVRPLGFDAGSSWSGTAPAFPWYISPDVRRERARGADIVVVYFHWGIERTFSPTARQRSLAQVAFDAGATIVVGAHPHVQQALERPRPRRLVKWSLGNFVFGANTPGTQSTGILRIRVGHAGVRTFGFRRARIGGLYGIQPRLT
jgi:capsule synthesis protein PGA_cap